MTIIILTARKDRITEYLPNPIKYIKLFFISFHFHFQIYFKYAQEHRRTRYRGVKQLDSYIYCLKYGAAYYL